jgi:hypothetical protein
VDAIFKVIEWESEIQKLAVIGDNVIRYYNENPEKRQNHIEKLYRLREGIAADNIPVTYKDGMLGEINIYIGRLNPENPKVIAFTPFHEAILFGTAGAMAAYIGKDSGKSLEDGVAQGIKAAFSSGDGSNG